VKKLFLVPFLIYSVSAFTMECDPQVEVSDDIENLLTGVKEKKRDWFAASEEKVLKAPCRKTYPDLATQEAYLKRVAEGSPTKQTTVGGVQLEDSPIMIALYRDMVGYDDFNEPPEESQNLAAKYSIGPDCKKVQCALGKIFGDKRAKEMLYMKQKFGINISPFTKDSRQSFNESELGHIKKAIMDFPPHLLPLDENRSCTRLHKDYTLGLGVLANATITFANDWNNYGPGLMEATVLHEMAHNFGSDKKIDESKDWLAASGWTQKGEEWVATKDNFVSDYAASNPHEDFAETTVAYRYDPEKLKRLSPEKYKILKDKVFGGVEYTNAQMCQDSNLSVFKGINKIKPGLASFNVSSIDPEMKKKLMSYCARDSLEAFIDRGYKPYEECIQGAIALELAKKQLIKDNPSMSPETIEANLFNKLNGKSAVEAFGINFPAAKKKEIADYSQKMMDEYELDAFPKMSTYLEYKNKEDYCKDWASEYSYQRLSSLEKNINNDLLLYKNGSKIAERFHDKCIRVQKSFPKFREFTNKDYSKLLR